MLQALFSSIEFLTEVVQNNILQYKFIVTIVHMSIELYLRHPYENSSFAHCSEQHFFLMAAEKINLAADK